MLWKLSGSWAEDSEMAMSSNGPRRTCPRRKGEILSKVLSANEDPAVSIAIAKDKGSLEAQESVNLKTAQSNYQARNRK